MEWFDVQFHQTKGRGNDETKFQQPRNYFQYAPRQEIDQKMMMGEVLSAFTFHRNPNKNIVSFGERGRMGFN